MRSKYLSSNPRLLLDYVTGYRALGLVLYGLLPSSVTAIGVIEVREIQGWWSLAFLGLLAVVPLLVLYLLVRQRLASWYLTDDLLWLRSAILTLLTLIFATGVAWAGGLADESRTVGAWSEWRQFSF